MRHQKFIVLLLVCMLVVACISPAYAAQEVTNDPGLKATDTATGTVFAPGDMLSIGGSDYRTGFDKAIKNYKLIAQFILGACAAICVVFFGKAVLGLSMGALARHPKERKSAIMGLMFSGIGIALFGGLTLLVSFAWDFLTNVG